MLSTHVWHQSFRSGSYDETLIQANTAILKWIDANGYQTRSPTREIYLHYQVNGDPSQFVTEIQIPIHAVH